MAEASILERLCCGHRFKDNSAYNKHQRRFHDAHFRARRGRPPTKAKKLTDDWEWVRPHITNLQKGEYYWHSDKLLPKITGQPRLDTQQPPNCRPMFIPLSDLPQALSDAEALDLLVEHKSNVRYWTNGLKDIENNTENAYARLLFGLSTCRSPMLGAAFTLEATKHVRVDRIAASHVYDQQEDEILLCPAGCFTDLHIDNGLSGVAWPIGNTVKLFTLYPPTEENLKELDKLQSQARRLESVIDTLKDGTIAIVDKDHPLFIPSGWPHAVVTLVSGFMYTTSFILDSGGMGLLKWHLFCQQQIESFDEREKSGCIRALLAQAQVSLGSRLYATQFLEMWPSVSSNLERLRWSKKEEVALRKTLQTGLDAQDQNTSDYKDIRNLWPFVSGRARPQAKQSGVHVPESKTSMLARAARPRQDVLERRQRRQN